jgi:hypothetical protein|uniref:Uncharacterized protein n=1 Tax=viral metagenome TaxID=1070528 RepID=A0A6C0BHJ8_9ZZZZ
MGNYIYYGYNSLRRTVTSEPAVKKVDTATSVVKVSRPDCESTPIEKVAVITTPVVKEEPKMEVEVKVEPKKEVKEEPKKEVEVKVKEIKVKEEPKKEVEVKVKEVEVKVEPKKEVEVKVKEVKVKEEKKEVKEEPKKEVEVKVEKKEVKEVEEKIVIDLKNVTKEKTKSPLLTPIEEESIYVHPYLLEYGTEPFKSDILLIQNEMYQPNKKKNKKKKNQPNVFSEE